MQIFFQNFNLAISHSLNLPYTQLIAGVIFALIISILSFRLKFLTLNGSLTQFILGSLIFGLGGLKWSVPIIVFFFLSSILSKLRRRLNPNVETYFEKSGTRDMFQVLANGGIGGILIIMSRFYHSELLYEVYVSYLAAFCADTWATELGTIKKMKTVNILNFKPVEQGVSGGVSITGMMGTVLGAFIIPLSSLSWISKNIFIFLLIVTVAGIIGSLVDSMLGALVQAQFKCDICGKITEKKFHCNQNSKLVHGTYWINNDIVNFTAGTIGGLFFILLRDLLKI